MLSLPRCASSSNSYNFPPLETKSHIIIIPCSDTRNADIYPLSLWFFRALAVPPWISTDNNLYSPPLHTKLSITQMCQRCFPSMMSPFLIFLGPTSSPSDYDRRLSTYTNTCIYTVPPSSLFTQRGSSCIPGEHKRPSSLPISILAAAVHKQPLTLLERKKCKVDRYNETHAHASTLDPLRSQTT